MTQFPLLQAEIGVAQYTSRFVSPETFLAACQACPNYGCCWSCPPYDFDVLDYWQRYSRLQLLVLKVPTAGLSPEEVGRQLAQARQELDTRLRELEQAHSGSVALQSGRCLLCERCARTSGEACRHPQRLRYSIESLGGDVSATLQELLGVELQWYSKDSSPDYLVQAGGLLSP